MSQPKQFGSVESFLKSNEDSGMLRVATAGSVDDGKSTLIGRLLYETKNIFEDTLASLKDKNSGARSEGEFDLSLLTDGLRAEREQKITIDVAYRYFSTAKRKFILADTPGHEQYTRNMATGASTADAAIVLIDARKGVLDQTKRHSFILSLLGVRHVTIAVNKMDAVDYSAEVFEKIRNDYIQFSAKLEIPDIHFIPISALKGDNITTRSKNTPWYRGDSILGHLEDLYTEGDRNLISFRYPIQMVVRPNQNYRGFAGQISSGIVRQGDEIMALPSRKKSRVKSITTFDGEQKEAFAPMSITLVLEDEIDLSRGDMLVRPPNLPEMANELDTMLVWMSETPMEKNTAYIMKHNTHMTRARVSHVRYQTDVNTLARLPSEGLKLNEIGKVCLRINESVFFDAYSVNRATGNFILVHPISNETVAAGMILGKLSPLDPVRDSDTNISKMRNITKEKALIKREDYEGLHNHKGVTIWLTGLSGSGKSTISKKLALTLFEAGFHVYNLDGDNIRHGLNKDLGFSQEDRSENIRRVAEVSKLMNETGFITIVGLISPLIEDRERAKKIVGSESFIEVFVDAPLEICEQRDVKGLYQKARKGEIDQFTGITAPYQAPTKFDLRIPTNEVSIENAVAMTFELVKDRVKIKS